MSTRDDDHDDDRDYKVGYRRPPKASQFKQGQSGNPRGRPKGAKGFTASLKRELEAKITVREGGREIQISKAEAAAKRLLEKALKGDLGALRMLAAVDADLASEVETAAAADLASREPEPGDHEILRHFADLARAGHWSPNEGEEKS